MTLMPEQVKNAKGDVWCVFSENNNKGRSLFLFVCMCVCETKIRGMLQRFKVPITAECSSNGISDTRRAQMAPKSFESF